MVDTPQGSVPQVKAGIKRPERAPQFNGLAQELPMWAERNLASYNYTHQMCGLGAEVQTLYREAGAGELKAGRQSLPAWV